MGNSENEIKFRNRVDKLYEELMFKNNTILTQRNNESFLDDYDLYEHKLEKIVELSKRKLSTSKSTKKKSVKAKSETALLIPGLDEQLLFDVLKERFNFVFNIFHS